MKIGFTGSRDGMTARQGIKLYEVIKKLSLEEGITDAHHGDCVGADDDFHFIMREYFASVRMSIHPSDIAGKRAHNTADHLYPVKEPLGRNRDIVNLIDVLIATPKTRFEQQRSGTWVTVRYARKLSKRVIIIYPDGSLGE